MNKLVELSLVFAKIGAFTFGGGYAMIPLLQKEVVEKKQWLNEEEILRIVTIAESTPGAISVNFATFVGYRVGGILGSIIATASIILPSFLFIILISFFLNTYASNPVINSILKGIQAGVVILLVNAVWKLLKLSKLTIFNLAMIILTILASLLFNISPFIILIIGAVFGIIYGVIKNFRNGEIEHA